MLLRILAVISVFAIAIFCFKDWTFKMLLAPSKWDFVTYRYIEKFLHWLGSSFTFSEYHINLIATELSSQFMKDSSIHCEPVGTFLSFLVNIIESSTSTAIIIHVTTHESAMGISSPNK